MGMDKVMEDRRQLLAEIRDSLLEELVACEIREPENEGEPEILTAVLDGIGEEGEKEGTIGEFFFMPMQSEDDTVQHFSAVLTIMDGVDELDEDKLSDLYRELNRINYRIPCGSFSVDEDEGLLCYRLTIPILITLTGDELLEQVNVCMANAVMCADLYADELIKMV